MTFSIIAYCNETQQLGGASSTAIPAVGALFPYIIPGVGIVATQCLVAPHVASSVLESMGQHIAPSEVLGRLMKDEAYQAYYQVAAVDRYGRTAAWTGDDCFDYKGVYEGEQCVVLGNMLGGPEVVNAMVEAFSRPSSGHDLGDRLLRALEAGQREGGDKRGCQSAVLKVCDSGAIPLLDVRVDDHHRPLEELRRIKTICDHQFTPFAKALGNPRAVDEQQIAEVREVLCRPPAERPGGEGPTC